MKIIATPKSILALSDELVGRHIATIEDETNGRRYAFVEHWKAPWTSPSENMVGWAVRDMDAKGAIDTDKLSDALIEVEEVVNNAGLKRN